MCNFLFKNKDTWSAWKGRNLKQNFKINPWSTWIGWNFEVKSPGEVHEVCGKMEIMKNLCKHLI